MSTNNSNKKYKRPKRQTVATTNPQASRKNYNENETQRAPQPRCPLLAKDSEWLDTLQTAPIDSRTSENVSDEEEVLQLVNYTYTYINDYNHAVPRPWITPTMVECEDGPEMKPLTIMFPGLLEEDPQTLENMLNKTMSTTEVTKRLLGQKADFSLMKKVNRLIPSDKKWLDTLSEDSSETMSGSYMGNHNNCKGSIESYTKKRKSSNSTGSTDNERAGTSTSKNIKEK